jgi:hypothetical protein
MHLTLTVLTLGVWGVCFLSAAAKRFIWPWRCEHCGWHEPDFRSPTERRCGQEKPLPRAGESGSLRRRKDGSIVSSSEWQGREGK